MTMATSVDPNGGQQIEKIPPPVLQSSTSPSQERSQLDIITQLLVAGVPHIVHQVFSYIDVKSLSALQLVCHSWNSTIADLPRWKHLIESKLESDPVWKGLFDRRGWHNYFTEPTPYNFYQRLYRGASKDICSLETNWKTGHYTLTRIVTASEIFCVQFDADKIVTGHADNTIKIWNRKTQRLSKTLEGHEDGVHSIQYDDVVLLSASRDRTVRLWNIDTGAMLGRLDQNYCWVWSLKFASDTMVTGDTNGMVTLWYYSHDVIDMRGMLMRHESEVWTVDINEKYVVSGSGDCSVMVWDPLTGDTTHVLMGHDGWVRGVKLHGHHAVSGSEDGTVRLWDVESGECLRVLDGHDEEEVRCVGFDGKRIISGDEQGIINVWDYQAALDPASPESSLCLATLKEHTDLVSGIQLDDFQLVTVSCDNTIVIWDFLDPIIPQL